MKIVGHRGARGLAPENTIASLLKAVEHNVDEIEFDIRVTKDNVVVLHHDKAIEIGNEKLEIKQRAYADLKEHKPDLATFQEVFYEVKAGVVLHIEVKAGEPIEPIIKVLKSELKKGRKAESLLLGSKSQKILLELHEVFPDITKVVIEAWSGVRATRRARQLNTKRLSMNKLWLWRGFINPMSKRGWELYAYTLNDPVKARRWASYGLAGVITDYPDLYNK